MSQPVPNIDPSSADGAAADRLLRVGQAYPMTGEGRVYRALALAP